MHLKNSPYRNISKYYPEPPPHYCMPINYANNMQKIVCLGWVVYANCRKICIVNIPEYDYKKGANHGQALWAPSLLVCIKKGNQI